MHGPLSRILIGTGPPIPSTFWTSSVLRDAATVPLILRLRARSFSISATSAALFCRHDRSAIVPREAPCALNEHCATCARFSTVRRTFHERTGPKEDSKIRRLAPLICDGWPHRPAPAGPCDLLWQVLSLSVALIVYYSVNLHGVR